MIDQPGSTRFQALLESAVQAYEKKAGVILADSEDSLAMRLQCCHSADDIATLLQGQARAIDDFQQRDRIFKSIKTTVSILSPISSFADDVGLVRRKVLMACFPSLTVFTDITPTRKGDTRYSRYPTAGMFLSSSRYPSDVQLNQAANCVITSCDVLANMLESIEHFINRLRIYTVTSHSMPAVDEIVVKLMVELISVLALVTRKLKKRRLRESLSHFLLRRYLTQRDAVKWVKNFFGVKDINTARQRLERLLKDEDRAVGAHTLKAVEGERTHAACNSRCIEHPSMSRQQSIH